jgi:methylenetetrahydrofolate dehydrogenase (NADP+)/methenyltetrahydrofolate cyclohydrolase
MPQILDGNRVRDDIMSELKPRVAALAARFRPPGLAVVLAGHNPASEIYVRNKVKACRDLGIRSETLTPPDSISTEELLGMVAQLNARPEVDGILVQLPLPPRVEARRVVAAVAGQPGLRACTPAGILELLKRHGIRIAGQRAVVVGRSDIVGKPVAFLLLHEHATVTMCHSRTADLAAVCREADILVAAIGRAAMITGEFLTPGVTVIDVGMNRIHDRGEVARIFRNSPQKLAAFDKNGSVLVGDVDPFDMAEKAAAYSPVPGGVGPLTIAMLMANTVAAAERRAGAC